MGRRKESSETGSELPRSFSYRGTPGNDLAHTIAIIAGSVYLPLYVAMRSWSQYEKGEVPWWAYLLAGTLALGGVAGLAEGWRRLQCVRSQRERGEKVTATSNGLAFEDRATFVDVRWDEITSVGQHENICLVQTSRGVIAFTKDLWGWEDLWKIIARHAPQSVTMMPEEAADAAGRIDYPAATVG